MSLEKKMGPLVLLGDPDPKSAAALCALLQSWQYSVEVVQSGPEALARLHEAPQISVALLANDLTQLSGTEVFDQWHRQPHPIPIWTMILSDSASAQQVMAAKEAGVKDFLVKPVSDLELHVRLKAAERVRALHCEVHDSLETMRFRSSHDSVTGLWNREYLLGMLFQETDRVQRMQTPLCFMLLHIDQFTHINLEHGSKHTDQVLRQLVERFRRYLRSYDLIGRYGDGNFLIALPGCSADDAMALGERLRGLLFRRPFDVGVDSVKLTGSFGIGQSKGRSPLVVLRETEHALGQAKVAGGNCLVRFGATAPASQTQPVATLPADPLADALPV